MASKLRAVSVVLILLVTFFVVVLPELNRSIVKAEEDIISRVLKHFVQPDLYTLEEIELNGEWLFLVKGYEEGVLESLYRPDTPLEGWKPVDVPFMFAAARWNSTLWLRRDFIVPDSFKGRRVRIVFLGAFYKAEVWLNGVYLGGHEGYFAPFYFDVTDLLNFEGVNTLVVCLSTPVETDLSNKRALLGIFGDWDAKPYPSWALNKLPSQYAWIVPIGLWRPVKLVATGSVAVNAVLVDTDYEPESRAARVRLKFFVTNAWGDRKVEIKYSIKPHNFEGKGVEGSLTFEIGESEYKWVEASLVVKDAKLWWIWDQGYPHLYMLEYEVLSNGQLQGRGKVVFGIREVEGSISPMEARLVLNGKRVFLRGVNYVSEFFLVKSTRARLSQDLKAILDANANFVRVHAHVEPPEFYSLADEMGIAVQADAPLIWAYASRIKGRSYSVFVENAQAQLVEMVLMLYNHPSVIIWTIHDEPPWASKRMGALYRRGVNRELDRMLAALVKGLDGHRRVVVEGGGYHDQRVFYGWFEGSWVDFLQDESPFPTELGAEALPSLESPFWDLVNVSEWPIKPGSRAYYELAYRGFQWAGGPVTPPYGTPDDYPSLSDYIVASQRYQAELLRLAITRYRILKFNVTAGLSIYTFKDCFPGATFSIVDYYGVPKLAYTVVSRLYKPLKLLIEPGGDFQTGGFRLTYEPGSLIRARIWVVNDAAEVKGTAKVFWKVLDRSTGKVLTEGSSNVTIPRSDEPAKLVAPIKLEAPAFADGPHELSIVATMVVDGVEVDSEEYTVVVLPASLVVAEIANASEPLEFLVETDAYSFYVRSENGTLEFAVPTGTNVRIYGPKVGSGTVYVPVAYDLGRVGAGVTRIRIDLVEGALVVLRTPMPSLSGEAALDIEIVVEPEEKLEGRFLLEYGSVNAPVMIALGLRGNEAVVPANVPVRVRFRVGRGLERIEGVIGPLTLAPGEVHVDLTLARKLADEALRTAKKIASLASSRLAWLRRKGFYAGLTEQMILEAISDLRTAVDVAEESPEEAATLASEAVEMLSSALNRINALYAEARVNLPLLILIILLSSLGLTSILVEEETRRPLIGTTVLVTLGLIAYLTYPGIAEINTVELFVSLYVSFFLLLLVVVLPHVLEGVKSESGLPVFAAMVAALSIAARNLRRRSLRTGLALLSIIAMSLAVTSLSSMSYYVSTRELVTGAAVPADAVNELMVMGGERGLTLDDVLYVSAQPEVADFGFKIDSLPRSEPYAYVQGREVRAFMALVGYSRLFSEISEIVEPASSLRELVSRGDAVIVSRRWRSIGIELGDTIVIGDLRLRVVGFYDPDALGKLKDVGGHDALPEAVYPDGSVAPAHPDDMVLLSPEAAAKLGGFISRIYAKASDAAQLKILARRLSTQAGYVVVAEPAGDYVRVYYVGPSVEFRGSEALLPAVLVFINVMAVVLASVYERRREIFTLASIGLNPTHIFLTFLSEAVLLGFTGGAIGYIASFALFRVLQPLGAMVPVDVKVDASSMVAVIAISTLSSTVAAVIPALKASAYATPSLVRRWRLEAEVVGNVWRVEVPARIPSAKAAHFADFLVERLREEEQGIERAILDVKLQQVTAEDGKPAYEVSFTYAKGGGRSFTASSRLVIKPVTSEFYGITLFVRPHSVYPRFYRSYVQEVTSYVRNLVLEWASLRVRLLAPVGSDVERVVEMVRHYNPQLVVLVGRGSGSRLARELRRRVRSLGLRPPAVEVVDLRGKSVEEMVNEVRALLAKVDIVSIDSDDGLLSAAVALAAALEGRRVSILADKKVEEVSIDRLLRPAA